MTSTKKLVAVSGVQPSGELHLGNYLGAIKQFTLLQEKYHTYFFIADLHALTEPQYPETLRAQTKNLAMLYLACGLDPNTTTLFVQSHISEHTELGWILNTMTPLGELERMTQFKEKAAKQGGVLAGLLNYPTLMAADILLYNPDIVPVGEDQLQHLELARTLARKFNSRFGETFREPKALLQKEGARIMGLDDPAKKMSKSATSKNNYIALLDSPKEIERKIKIAVTDSGKDITMDSKKPAISNLLSIYSLCADIAIPELEKQYKGKSYAEFKSDLAQAIITSLSPIQNKYHALAKDPARVVQILSDGAVRARETASATMKTVRERVGLVPLEN